MKKFFSLLALMLLCSVGAWAQEPSYAGTWYLQEASTGQFVNVSKVSSWASELHLDATAAATFVVEAANDAYTIKHSGRSNNIGGNNGGHDRMYNDCTNSNNYTFEVVEGGVKIKDAANYYICFDTPANSLYLKNDVAGSVFRLVSAEQYANSIVDVTYMVRNISGQEAPYTMKALLGEKVVAPFMPFFSDGTVTDTEKTVTAENKTFHVTGTWAFPFEQGKYYTMKASNSSNNFVFNGTNAYCNNSTAPTLDNDKWSFEHVATSLDLFKVKNEKGGYATIASATNQTLVTFSATPTEWTSGTGATSYFRITKNSTDLTSGFNLQHPGNKQANVGNHVSAGLGVWNPGNDNAINNDGSCMLVTEVTLSSLVDFKTEATDVVDSWPLASQTVKDNAKSAINAAADRDAVKTALANGYAAYNTEISAKYYHIKSAFSNYQTKQGVDKAFIAGDSKVTWGNFDAGNPYQYFQITVTTAGYYNIKSYKVDKFMTATNGTLGASATNNTILKSLGEGQFNITVGSGNPCHTEGHSEGAGVSGNIVAWAGGANSCSAWTIAETTAEAYNAANNKTINYTITDAAGTQYTGSYSGGKGDMPPFTGVTGQTYQNAVWGEDGDNLTLTANITFPFPVSKTGTDNWTYVGSFNSLNYLWYAKDNALKFNKDVLPNNGNVESYMWAIYPSFNEGAFTFKIKNKATDTYLAGADTGYGTVFAMNAEGKAYTFATHLTNKNGFYDPSVSKFITINSNTTPGEQNAFLWAASGSHNGSNMVFGTPTDFEALMTTLGQYEVGEGVGKYSTTEDNATKIAAVKAGTQFATAAEFSTMINACTINQPVRGKFYRFRTGATEYSDHYLTNYALTDVQTLGTTSTNKNESAVIWYLDNDGKLLSYLNGTYINSTNITNVANQEDGKVVEFGDGAKAASSAKVPGTYWINASGDGNGSATTLLAWNYGNRKSLYNSNATDRRCQWAIEEVEVLPVTMVNADDAYYASLHLPVAVTLPAGLKAYSAEVEGDAIVLTKVVENDILAAWTPVILYSESEVNDPMAITTGGEMKPSDLSGTVAALSAAEGQVGYGAYVLNHKSHANIGFYKTTTKINGFKAYLGAGAVTSSSNALSFRFEDVTTAISAIEGNSKNVEIFDLNGRRLSKAQKGMNIINGVKVLVK